MSISIHISIGALVVGIASAIVSIESTNKTTFQFSPQNRKDDAFEAGTVSQQFRSYAHPK